MADGAARVGGLDEYDLVVTPPVGLLLIAVHVNGDFDGDRDVDTNDLAVFEFCTSGPGIPLAGDCAKADFDADGDADQSDFGLFQKCLSGEGNPADPNCAG